jgi:catechol 2,3-dioxygenase-like lactoylglutathione lyase family enzyme
VTVRRLDHLAIPVADMEPMLAFYRAIGFTVDDEHAPLLYSVCQGDMKLNLHAPRLWRSERFTLRAPAAEPGCGDLCLVWDGGEEELEARLASAGVEVIEGPVERVGGADRGRARGISRYVRDPDGNLIEFIVYRPPGPPGAGPRP